MNNLRADDVIATLLNASGAVWEQSVKAYRSVPWWRLVRKVNALTRSFFCGVMFDYWLAMYDQFNRSQQNGGKS